MDKLLSNIHWFIIIWAIYNNVMLYKDKTDKINEIKEQQENVQTILIKEKKERKEILSFSKDIDAAKENIERVAREIEKTQQLLPSDISDNDNNTLLRKMAEDLNVQESKVTPEPEVDRGFYFARRYRFTAKATYLQLLIMFEKIAESKRILNVAELDFRKLEQPQRSKFQLINGEFLLEAYRYNANYKEDRGIENISSQFAETEKKPKKGKKARAQSTGESE